MIVIQLSDPHILAPGELLYRGGASLTPFGAEVLERYNRIRDRAATKAVDDLAALARRARPDAGPKV